MGRGIMPHCRCIDTQLGPDTTGKPLAGFHPPLITEIEMPAHIFHEDLVRMQRDRHARFMQRQLPHQRHIAGAIAGKRLVRNELAAPFRSLPPRAYDRVSGPRPVRER